MDINEGKYRLSVGDRKYGVREEGYTRNEQHNYIDFSNDRLTGVISFIGESLIDYYANTIGLTLKEWKKEDKLYSFQYGRDETSISKEFNYKTLTDKLRKSGQFNPNELNLPDYACFWLDFSIDARSEFYMADEDSVTFIVDGTPQKQYGDTFPIKPTIDREGYIITSFNPQLIKKIISKRKELVQTSNQIFEFNWLYGLKELINDSISLLDITLLQIYTKAEYDSSSHWNKFDRHILGEKYNRRLKDKIKWVLQITGRDPNIEAHLPNITYLKEIRNHLNHFDPPIFAFTLEEAVDWLNHILDVAFSLCKIRKVLGVELSTDLINLTLQKQVKFIPEPEFLNRKPLNKEQSGYQTSTWPPQTDQ